MMFGRDPYIAHLLDEIDWLRTQMLRERQRAEDAVSQLLAVQTQGVASLPPRPLIADHEKDVERELAEMQSNPDWAQAGA